MGGDVLEPMDAFEVWLLRRVVQAVEAGEVSADLLTDLQAEIESASGMPQEEGEAAAIRQVADLVGISEERAAKLLAAIEVGSTVARQRLLRGIAEAWLEAQRRAYTEGRHKSGS